ncbi:MAG: RtcB family protein [Candidatus Aenigmarchaeota archaeon]|nr:RtcB family protein [Candidatus Aenigmarchaeota archaeon]
MKVPSRIYATKKIVDEMDLQVYDQITNVANLPGIQKYAFCMADGHSGYGFPIGGVAAFDPEENGVISPGGIGFDINCGMRLVLTNLTQKDVQPHLKPLVDKLFERVPAGVGSTGFVKLTKNEFKKVVVDGAEWCVDNGYAWKEDLERTELNGKADWSDVSKVSSKAVERGFSQIGTLGSGNHYLEIQVVKEENIFDKNLAKKWGLFPNQVVIMFHCLPGDAKVLTEHGAWIRIKDMENSNLKVKCFDEKTHEVLDTEIENFYKIENREKLFKIKTKSGKEIIATEDHPFLTKDGLKLVREFKSSVRVAVNPYEGVEYEDPSDETIVTEEDIRKIEDNDRIVNRLKKQGLLPLKMDNQKLPILTKLLGFLTGDGWLGRAKGRWSMKFIGKLENLERIREDIKKLGYSATKVYTQRCKSNVTYTDGKKRTIDGETNTTVIGSLSLPILMYALGAPLGNKSRKEFEVPRWILQSPLWIKRLYLAGYFGAELTKPSIRLIEKYRFGMARLSINKLADKKENGLKFLRQIESLLNEFGVKVAKTFEIKGVKTKDGKETIKLRIDISSKEDNLKKLWSKIGFEYCEDRTNLSAYALQYLNCKNKLLEEESKLTNKTKNQLAITPFKFRSIKYPTFNEFREEFKFNPPTPIIWDEVESIEEIENNGKFVYDIRVKNKNHNFVADNFVTGNCGSRGFGHQIGTDYLQLFLSVMERKYGIKILDPELACAPFNSPEGQDYFKAMAAGVNMSFVNRQVILHRIREVFSDVFKQDAEKLGLKMVFDVSHNRASLEEHEVDGKKKKLIVHRKGATGSYPAGREEIPKLYRNDGSPVIIGGSMETGSYLLVGGEKAPETFCSTAHGSGRTMSRTRATRLFRGEDLQRDMMKRGIYVKSVSWSGLAEEAGPAYKNVDDVIDATHLSGISKKVVKFAPIGNVKG